MRAGFASLVSLVGTLLCAACEMESPPQHVILISADTLRADHLGTYGYLRETSPRIDAFAATGIVFERAWVQWPKTTPSMVSMFSGTYPHENGIVVLARPQIVPDEMTLFPELLAQAGIATAAVVSNSVLGRESNFQQGFERYREVWLDEARHKIRADHVTDVALEVVDELVAEGRRFFLWVHYQDPHTPYVPPREYFEPFLEDKWFESRRAPHNADDRSYRGISRKVWSMKRARSSDDVGYYVAKYDGEIRYMDEQIGRLFDELAGRGVLDESLIGFTADHGESLGEHDYYFHHGHVPYEPEVRVPLVFRWPNGRHGGRRIAHPVELRGLGRTLLEALGVDAAPLGGSSLLPALTDGETSSLPDRIFTTSGSAATFSGARYTLAVLERGLKLVLPRSEWGRGVHGGREFELYALSDDPDEERDLAPTRAGDARTLRETLASWWLDVPPVPPIRVQDDAVRYREETVRNLRELGYLE
jgi:arylsulfatase A-like enzyme